MTERLLSARETRRQAFIRSEREMQDLSHKDKEGAWVYRDSPLYLRLRAIPTLARYRTAKAIYRDKTVHEDSPLHRFLNVAPFEFHFRPVLPKGERRLKNYIENTLSDKFGEAIGVELGGIGSKVFSQFTPGFFNRTAAISFHDYRDKIDPRLKERDKKRNHTIIPGNILDNETQDKLIDWLQGRKIDVLFHRMLGGNGTIPDEPFFVSKQANIWYKLLADGGMIFSQVPNAFESYIEMWAESVNAQYQGRLEAVVGSTDIGGKAIKLRKLKGAPVQLPVFSARDMLRIQKQVNDLPEAA